MTQDWIKKLFKLDQILETIIFHVQVCLAKGRGKKVTIPTFIAQLPIRPKMEHQLDRPVGYYRAQKGKGRGKRKRNYPPQIEPEEGEIMAPP